MQHHGNLLVKGRWIGGKFCTATAGQIMMLFALEILRPQGLDAGIEHWHAVLMVYSQLVTKSTHFLPTHLQVNSSPGQLIPETNLTLALALSPNPKSNLALIPTLALTLNPTITLFGSIELSWGRIDCQLSLWFFMPLLTYK